MRWRHSLRARLTLWYVAVLAALVVACAAVAIFLIDEVVGERTDRFLRETSRAFRAELGAEYAETGTVDTAVRMALAEFQFRDTRVVVLEPGPSDVRLLGATRDVLPRASDPREDEAPRLNLELLRRAIARLRTDAPRTFTLDDSEGGYRVHLRPDTVGGSRLLIVTARPLHDQYEETEEVALAFLVALPVLLALAAAGGVLVAGRGLAPLAAMGRRAAAISATNLHDRVPVANARDELGELAAVINSLLARLEASFEQQRRFMADASHELRTPVTIVRNEAEIALSRQDRDVREYQDSLRIVRGEAVRLSRIVNDLFLLARADAGRYPLQTVELYLDELADDVARALRSVADARGIAIRARNAGEMPYRGDEALLRRVLVNLLDNAIRHAPAGSPVDVVSERRGGTYSVEVRDGGGGIPPEARERLFERFFRADPSRGRGEADAGAGLGLSIARWVAEAHGGMLELVDSSPDAGTIFRLTLPVPPGGATPGGAPPGAPLPQPPSVASGRPAS